MLESMPDNKNQHYVPKLYLRKFSEHRESVNLFNLKSSRSIYGAPMKGQCSKDYFYGKDAKIEKALIEIEGKFAELLKFISEHKLIPRPHSPNHFGLLMQIALQYGRTAYQAESLNELANQVARHFLEVEFGPLPEGLRVDFKNAAAHSVAVSMQSYGRLIDMNMLLLVAPLGTEFVTSDTPVVFYNQFLEQDKLGEPTGLSTKGLQVFFPISASLLIMLYDGGVYGTKRSSVEMPLIISEADVEEINRLQFVSALQNVYFKSNLVKAEAQWLKAKPYRRSRKIVQRITSATGNPSLRQNEISGKTLTVKTNLVLSFLKLKKAAKNWYADVIKKERVSSLFRRNIELEKCHETFHSLVKQGLYTWSEFPIFFLTGGQKIKDMAQAAELLNPNGKRSG